LTESDKKKTIKKNTVLWIGAMILAPLFHLMFLILASGPVKFPWPILMPMLMIGFLLASNKLLTDAIGETSEDATGDN
jgi:hypothetical protein